MERVPGASFHGPGEAQNLTGLGREQVGHGPRSQGVCVKRAIVAGAGYAGLTAALGLVRRGWSVEVFERAPNVRTEGYSIAFHENGLRTLEALGLIDRALEQAQIMPSRQIRDRHGRVLSDFEAGYRVYRITRIHLVSVLAEEARRLGAGFRFGAAVIGADRDGALIRDGLRLLASRLVPNEGAIRIVVPRTPGEAGEGDDGRTGFEFWSGRRRFMYRPASPTTAYLTFACPADDARGRRVPIDADLWAEAFPVAAHVIARTAREADWSEARWAQFQIIRLKRWSEGRVAVVGDAAHAMLPNLGQGGNCAMMNALALAAFADAGPDVMTALQAWERSERPIIEHAQRWSSAFSAPLAWPEWLQTLVVPMFSRSRWVQDQMTRPARYEPKRTLGSVESRPAA